MKKIPTRKPDTWGTPSLYVLVSYNSGILSPMYAAKNKEQLNTWATRPASPCLYKLALQMMDSYEP